MHTNKEKEEGRRKKEENWPQMKTDRTDGQRSSFPLPEHHGACNVPSDHDSLRN
jgi:hypothetical protein